VKLVQIPFSHNCVKVRVALTLKKIDYEVRNISPMDRSAVVAASRQGLVPVLIDGDRAISDSTAILLYLDERHPDPPLVPGNPGLRAECLVLEDWADQAFMAISRRIAYWNVTSTPGQLARMFFPGETGFTVRFKERIAKRRVRDRFRVSETSYRRDVPEVKRVAAIALARLGGRPWLFDGGPTIADVALATMSAPLAGDPGLRGDPAVAALLGWGEALVPADMLAFYRR
jgi:glutathione S-transferase